MALIFETLCGEDLELGVGTTTKLAPGGGSLASTQVSLSTFAINGASSQAATASWTPDDIAASQSVTTTVAVLGAALGDFVLVSYNKDLQGATLSAYVSVANIVTVVMANPTSAAISPTAGTAKVLVFSVR